MHSGAATLATSLTRMATRGRWRGIQGLPSNRTGAFAYPDSLALRRQVSGRSIQGIVHRIVSARISSSIDARWGSVSVEVARGANRPVLGNPSPLRGRL